MTTEEIKTLLSEGAELHMKGDLDEAEKKYRIAIEMNGSSAVAHNNLGFLLAQRTRFDEAEKEYMKAIELSPDYSTAYNNLGQAYLMMQRWEDAENNLLEAVSLDEDDFYANEGLAKLYMMKGDGYNAEQYWKKTYLLKPESGHLINLAHCLILQQKADEALEELNRAMPEEEENERLYSLLGIIYFCKYDFGSAIKCFKRSLGINPEDTEVRHNLSMAYLKTDQGEEALQELRRILLLKPDHTEARNNLAVVELSAGQTESALNHFNIVIEQEPENAKALYYKSVILLQKGDVQQSKYFIQKTIATGNEDYKQKANELFETINNMS